MMKRIYTVTALVVGFALQGWGQVNFVEVNTLEEMEKVQQRASDQQLMLFVDVYATWCGPCKVMDQEVYSDPAVADYMNAHFVSVKMDGETEYGRVYAAEQRLEGYPSMFIFSDEGEPVNGIIGYTPAEELIPLLKETEENYRTVKRYRALYSRGTLEDQDFAGFVAAVRSMGNQEEAERLAGEYMDRIMDERLSDSDISVVAFYTDLGDKWWPSFSSDPERLKGVLGDDYSLALEKIYNNSLVKAVEEEDAGLVSRISNELTPMLEVEGTSVWDLRSLPFIQYYYYTDQVGALIDYVDGRFASDRKGDHRWLYGAASRITDMDQQYRTEALMRKEAEWFQTCIDLEKQFDYYFYHGMVLYLLMEQEGALSSLRQAESLAADDEQKAMIAQVLQIVDSR